MPLPVGPKAIALIIAQEVVSEEWYNANASHPVWPGGMSGVTIGCGYDLGQQSDAVILKDWIPSLGNACAILLSKCAGISGPHAQTALSFVKPLTIPWSAALNVFQSSTLPRYAAQTEAALPNCDQLPPDAYGALVSIGYNRGNGGWTMGDDRHAEMEDIHDALAAKDFASVPASIRAMQRLWPEGSALWKRREAEAALFEAALSATGEAT
jgi:hypothetical protein